ncbi:hypothetical protein FRC14_006290 [Serendipita sp. 396]|nr:hypothetical protein FRC14_006290 [Serendipita sp. 396]KAG8793879.1 hypothetical protein FRC16_010795 [Serendipita sp. 398]KAG8871677.1 hypothetical protein FRC20_010299 [Serendipita sp. 405]
MAASVLALKSCVESPSASAIYRISAASCSKQGIFQTSRRRNSSRAGIHGDLSSGAFTRPTIVQPDKFATVLDRKAPLTKALLALEKAVESKNMVAAFRICTMFKRHELKPTLAFYRALMQLCSEKHMHKEIRALFHDAEALGLVPDREMWNYLLQAESHTTYALSATRKQMQQAGIVLNARSYRTIIRHYAETGNVLMCLRTLQEMKDNKVMPDITTVEELVVRACTDSLPRLGHGLAVDYESKSSRRLSHHVWTQILAASAHLFYTNGVIEGWQRLVVDGGITPDEGICTMVINAAAVAGITDLVESAIDTLKATNVLLREHHIAPFMATLTTRGEIHKALELFEFMEKNNIQPTRFTARPLTKLLSTQGNLDIAIAHLRDRATTKGYNPVGAFNCILAATLKERTNYTIALSKEINDLKVTPTIDTFNILIHSACIHLNAPAAQAYFEEMLSRGLEPNKETYERIIMLLTSEPVYDDAFLFLQKMNSVRLVPSFDVLVGLAKKCSLRYDARWKSLVGQMEKYNYVVSDELMDYLHTNGRLHMTDGSMSRIGRSSSIAMEDAETVDSSLSPSNSRPEFL